MLLRADQTPRCVLVVEPDRRFRLALQRLLELRGFHVEAVESAAEARVTLNGHDALLLELDLPDGCGTDVLREIRKAGHRLPALLMSESAGAANRVESESSRQGAILSKPINVNYLLDWLGRVL